MTVNRLILGDNLEILKTLDAESVELVYLDPPFFSNRNYEVIWGDVKMSSVKRQNGFIKNQYRRS